MSPGLTLNRDDIPDTDVPSPLPSGILARLPTFFSTPAQQRAPQLPQKNPPTPLLVIIHTQLLPHFPLPLMP